MLDSRGSPPARAWAATEDQVFIAAAWRLEQARNATLRVCIGSTDPARKRLLTRYASYASLECDVERSCHEHRDLTDDSPTLSPTRHYVIA
jgi:hypothetical protein